MGDALPQDSAFSQLNSEQKELLNIIDDLRKYKVDKVVDLPQIIVVGDQSSGKSSVLESISRVRFPSQASLCTRFATELVLRNEPTRSTVNVQVQHEDGLVTDIEASPETIFDTDALPKIIEEAGDKMVRDNAGFSKDVLRIEVSGPRVPHLTLVDLPGFYYAENDVQSAEGRQLVQNLAGQYMARQNSIILAIVSARNDMILQSVLSKVKEHDRNGERTLGVITKPDLLLPGKDQEEMLLRAENNADRAHRLALGWHVLRNRSSDEKEDPDDQRDERERALLDNAPWSSLPSANRGVEALRTKLSKILMRHIQTTLPSLVESIQIKISECQVKLKSLGEPRTTPREMRAFLDRVASQFQTLSSSAIEGNYRDGFFGGLYPSDDHDGKVKKLRALVRDLNRAFSYVLSTKGARRQITEEDDDGMTTRSEGWKVDAPQRIKAMADTYEFPDPHQVDVATITAELEDLSSVNQGNEFPGTSNDLLALKLFQDQMQPWEDISRFHIRQITTLSKAFVEKLLVYILADDDEAPFWAICQKLVDPFFTERASILEKKLEELLFHYKDGHPQPFDAEFRALLDARQRRNTMSDAIQQLLATKPELFTDAGRAQLATEPEATREDRSSVLDILEKSETYYEVLMNPQMSIRTFVDNVIVLALENCLIRKQPTIITTEKVSRMEDDELELLAAESPNNQRERADLQRRHNAMREALQKLGQYRGRTGTAAPPVVALGGMRMSAGSAESTRRLLTDRSSPSPQPSPSDRGGSGRGARTPSTGASSHTVPGSSPGPSGNGDGGNNAAAGGRLSAVPDRTRATEAGSPASAGGGGFSFGGWNQNTNGSSSDGGDGGDGSNAKKSKSGPSPFQFLSDKPSGGGVSSAAHPTSIFNTSANASSSGGGAGGGSSSGGFFGTSAQPPAWNPFAPVSSSSSTASPSFKATGGGQSGAATGPALFGSGGGGSSLGTTTGQAGGGGFFGSNSNNTSGNPPASGGLFGHSAGKSPSRLGGAVYFPNFKPTEEREGWMSNAINSFQHICCDPKYVDWSPEELRLQASARNGAR